MSEERKYPELMRAPIVPETQATAARGGWQFKDSWAILVSTLAFAVSAGSFYMTNLEQVDDLKVIFQQLPTLHIDKDGPHATGPFQLLFVNSGNQSAAFVGVVIFTTQLQPSTDVTPQVLTSPAPAARCSVGSLTGGDISETNLMPFVLKPGEIAVRDFSVTRTFTLGALPARANTSKTRNNQRFDNVALCFVIYFATPSTSHGFAQIRFVTSGSSDAATFDKSFTTSPVGESPYSTPFVIRHASRNALKSWLSDRLTGIRFSKNNS
jgi:hypothetical protein